MSEFDARAIFDERAFEEDAVQYREHVRWWAWMQVAIAVALWGAALLGISAICTIAFGYELPPAGVPGAITAAVSQENIETTICRRGWTLTQRPSEAWSHAIKVSLVGAGSIRDFELDHLVPLELGGAPESRQNLWLQPWSEARIKDRLENQLRALVCARIVPLIEAQRAIASDWVSAYRRYVGELP